MLADIERQQQEATANAGIQTERLLRNFNRFDLPNLLSSQAAKGAYGSSATANKREALTMGVGDQVTDVEMGLAQTQAKLAAQALLAQSGIQLGSL